MIDEEATFERFGYYSTDLTQKSTKQIVKVCANCGECKVVEKGAYRDLCNSCANKQKQQLPKPKFVSEKNRFIPNTGIDRVLTIERFGYDPIDLKENSGRKIIAICQDCGKIREIKFCQYYDLCLSCSKKGETNSMYGMKGEYHPKWNPDLTDDDRMNGRCISGYDEWRDEVYKRDNYTCKVCGDDAGGNLNAHHIESYYNNPDLRITLSNGITLCEKCHKDFHHIYGRGNNTQKQFDEFKNR